ncbi:hypothetical protein RSAG8_04903, partial [Rhizoctonia solani AG-8 WAC10335]
MQQELENIDKNIEFLSRVLSRTPDDDPNLRLLLTCLGKAHHKRYDLLEEPNDIHKTVEYTTIVLTLTPDDDPGLPGLLSTLGTAHGQRFRRLGRTDDIERAIEYKLLTLALTPEGHPHLPRQLANLAVSHKDRFERLGELGDIEKAIKYDARAVAVTPSDNPNLPNRLEKLGMSHSHRFECLGELNDLERAIEYQSRGLALTPGGHPSLPTMLANLATSHTHRFQRLGGLDDLEKSIKYESHALALIPGGHQHLSGMLGNLVTSYNYRFVRLGEPDDLEKAIEYQSQALALTPAGHPDLPSQLSNLGTSLSDRFQCLGKLDDLEKAIEYLSQALTLTPDGHPDLPSRLTNLGISLGGRFQHLGQLGDLEKALEYESRALALTPDGHPQLSSRLGNLGTSYSYRFVRLGEPDDLEKAINYESRALALTPDGHPQLSSRLENLGISHSYRFQHLGKLDDLEKALEYGSRALALTPDGHPRLSHRLANLGGSHSYRFRQMGELSVLEKAIEYQSRALQLTTGNNPDLCSMHFNLAVSHVYFHEHSMDPSHLQNSLNSFRIACTSLAGAPRDKFRHAHGWAKNASIHSTLNCIEAYQTTIDLLPQFIWLGATTGQRYEDLKMTEVLAVNAASTAILSSNYSLALEWLEHTRCIVWNQYLMLRSPLDQLQSTNPVLATRLQTIDQLHWVSSEPRESQALYSGSMATEQVAHEHRRLVKEYENLLSEARTLPGFEDFLLPIRKNKLVSAAWSGPIVVINCHQDCCDALLVLPEQGDIKHLPLPNFTREKALRACTEIETSLRLQRLRERGVKRLEDPAQQDNFGSVLAILWYDIVKPVLHFLGYVNLAENNLPHITWCPTGPLSFLPLHAAGDYDQPQARVFNYAISSYTPTLAARLHSTPSSLTPTSRVLGVALEVTPGHNRLPGTTNELACVKEHVGTNVGYSQLVNNQATISAVLDAMEEHDWVHLACHAHQNVKDPTKSGLFLHDGTLDLAAINRRSFKKKGLAFLSACQTATGDQTLPDEAVHLASGMLMAGYSSVIATMWSVVDQDAPFVADKVYSELMKDGKLGNGEAGKALHNAVAGLRGRVGEKKFARWVPYIHIGS